VLLETMAKLHQERMAGRGYSPATLRLFDLAQRQFIAYLSDAVGGAPSLADVTLDAGVKWQNVLFDRKLSKTSVCSYTLSVRSWTGWIAEELPREFPEGNPLARLVPPKPESVIPHRLSVQEINALLGACGSMQYDARNTALILLLWDSGLRVSELVSLQIRDVTPAQTSRPGLVHVRQGKGNRERWTGIGQRTSEAIAAYIDARNEACASPRERLQREDWLFASHRREQFSPRGVRKMLKTLAVLADVDPERVHPHAFRHTFGRGQTRMGTSSLAVQEFLGHATSDMTSHYAALEAGDVEHVFVSLVDRSLSGFGLQKRGNGRQS
jgi:integrase/recombinase XerD